MKLESMSSLQETSGQQRPSLGVVVFEVFLLGLLALLAPMLKLLAFNAEYFGLALPGVLVLSLLPALAAALLVALLGCVDRLRLPILVLARLLFLAAVVATFLLPVKLAPLDDLNSFVLQVRKEAFLLAALAALLAVALCLLRGRLDLRALTRVPLVMGVSYVLLFTGYSLASGRVPLRAPTPDAGRALDWERISTTRNIFILSFDQVQGHVLAEHLRRNPRLAAPLQGFVFYRDAATTYPSTNFSISSILSGRMARNAAEGAEHAMESPDSLLAQARRAGYGVYTTRRWSQGTDYGCVLCTELGQAERVAKRQELLRHAVNLGFGVDIEDLPVAGPRLARLGGRAAGSLGWKMDFEGLPGQLARVRAVETGPRFYFMHFFGSHMPFTYASDCRPVPPEMIAGIQTLDGAKASLDCAMSVVGAFLDKLRSEGVYDRSMVFVVSDHGYNLLLNEQASQPAAAPYFGEGTAELGHPSNFRPAGIYNPVLMFKDFDRNGPLAMDRSPASLLDVAATVCGRVSLCTPGAEGMDLRQALPEQRRRRFYMYVGGVDEHRRTADGRDKFHGGLDEFFEVRSFQGPLYPNLAESLRHGRPEPRPGAAP